MKRQPTKWEIILANHIYLIKDMYSENIKNSYILGHFLSCLNLHFLSLRAIFKMSKGGDLQDSRRVWHGDHLPPHKYIRNTSTCGTTPTEHLLNAGRRPQTSQKGLGAPAGCQACASEVGERSSGHWSTRDLSAPRNIKQRKSPRDLHLKAKAQLHSTMSKLQCWTPYAKQLARQEHNTTH